MANLKNRVERLQNELRFRAWLAFERFLEGLSDEHLDDVATNWRFPEPWPEPLPQGSSRLDALDRKSLLKEWQESERELGKVKFMRRRSGSVTLGLIPLPGCKGVCLEVVRMEAMNDDHCK